VIETWNPETSPLHQKPSPERPSPKNRTETTQPSRLTQLPACPSRRLAVSSQNPSLRKRTHV